MVESGTVKNGETVALIIDKEKRLKIANNHTAVHLLQSALQNIYGKNLHQTGSKVEEAKLRFDFNYDNQISEEEISLIKEIFNCVGITEQLRLNQKKIIRSFGKWRYGAF